MRKEFVSVKQTLKLNELGFNEQCLGWYPDNAAALALDGVYIGKPSSGSYKLLAYAPLYQQAFKWIREKHNIDISINTIYSKYNENTIKKYSGVIDNKTMYTNVGFYDNYEEAELAGLQKMIEIIEKK
jgi:hypothetical protein